MTKKIPSLLTIIFSVLTIQSFSQIGWDSLTIQSKSRLFFGYSYSVLPDIEKGPVNIYPHYSADNTPVPPFPRQGDAAVFVFNTNFVSGGAKIRYNVIQFNSRTSISITAAPSFGIGFTVVDEPDVYQIIPYANCSYNMPVMLEFSYGNGATRNSLNEYGIFAFTGIEYTGLLFKNGIQNGDLMDETGNYYTPEYTRNWTEAVFGLGVRYNTIRNKAREVFLKFGIGPEKLHVTPLEKVEADRSWTLKLTFVRNF